jgi:type I restriction enzyme S subunit
VNKFNVPVIPKDTVVLSFKMTVGRVAITTEEMLSNEAIAHFKFNNKTPFTKEYLYLFLKLYQYDSLGSTSSIVTAINSTMIKEMEIIIPDNEKMSDFQDNTELLFNKIRQNQKQIHTLEKMRDTLLPKLMSGEVMVNVNTKI